MKRETLRENFIRSMTEHLPPGMRLAKYLSSILYMGKEAVYRRLRGDVAFSLEEAALISEKMDVSLDQIIRLSASNNNNIFPISLLEQVNPIEKYCSFLEKKVNDQKKLFSSGNAEIGSSSCALPSLFTHRYDNIAKFDSYKWLCQFPYSDEQKTYSEVVIPEKMRSLQKEYSSQFREVGYMYYVWSEQLFYNYVKEVEYYMNLRKITGQEAKVICEELLSMIDEIERTATKGELGDHAKIDIYVSSTNLDSTYIYLENESVHLSLIRIFMMDSVVSRDPMVCNGFKKWINSVRRISTLISKSGEMQRVNFFRKQREIVHSLQIA